MNFFYANAANEPVGPLPEEQLHELYRKGTISLDTFVVAEEGSEWKSYRSIKTPIPLFKPETLPSRNRPVIEPQNPSNQLTKKCPFCAELISVDAKKCKHCGEMIDAALRAEEEAKRITAAQAGITCGTVAVTAAHEEEIWTGSPSQLLNIKLYVIWGLVLIATVIAGLIQPVFFILLIGLIIIAMIQCTLAYLNIRKTRYTITTQRVKVTTGIFTMDIQEIELFRVKDTAAHQPFFMRLFKIGMVQLVSGDSKNPNIFLKAIPKPRETRERIRQEVLGLRQKLGVRELDVM